MIPTREIEVTQSLNSGSSPKHDPSELCHLSYHNFSSVKIRTPHVFMMHYSKLSYVLWVEIHIPSFIYGKIVPPHYKHIMLSHFVVHIMTWSPLCTDHRSKRTEDHVLSSRSSVPFESHFRSPHEKLVVEETPRTV